MKSPRLAVSHQNLGIALVSIVLLGATAVTGCSSSTDTAPASPVATAGASTAASAAAPTSAPTVAPTAPIDTPPRGITLEENGTTINLVPGQIGCIEGIEGQVRLTTTDFEIVDTAEGIVADDGTSCGPAVVAFAVGSADIVVADLDGNPVLEFTVEVIPAD